VSPSDDGQPIGDMAAQAQAASAALEAQQRGSGTPDNTNAPANTQSMKANVGQLTTNLNNGGGSTSHGGGFYGGGSPSAAAHDAAHIAKAAPAGSAGAYGASAVPNTAARTPVLGRSAIQRAGGGAMGQLQ